MHVLRLLPAILLLIGATSLNEYVGLEVRPALAEMRPGESGVIELRFRPADGIHVNSDPPVQFTLDSGGAVILDGKPVMTTDARTGYLSAKAPVTQKVTLGSAAAPGRLTVKGTVTYFYCSDTEGWCNRQKQPVKFTITVRP